MILRCFLGLIAACVLHSQAVRAEENVLRLAPAQTRPLPLAPFVSVLEDATNMLAIDNLRDGEIARRFVSPPDAGDSLNFGFTASAHWLKLKVANPSDQPLERVVEIAFAQLNNVQFHVVDANGQRQSWLAGNAMPFSTRPIDSRFFAFPLSVPAHEERTVFIRVTALGAMVLPVRLWEPKAYERYQRADYAAQAAYFGMAGAMVLFNLLLFIGLRDSIYLTYVFLTAGTALALASRGGLGQQVLWPLASQWTTLSTYALFAVASVFALIFTRQMLNSAQVIPRIDATLKLLTGTMALAPIALVLTPHAAIKPMTYLILTNGAFMLGAGIVCALKRQRNAYFFVAAFAILIIGSQLAALRSLGYLETNVITENGFQLGSALEMLLLAFALADRFNELRREKVRAQKEALDAQQQLVSSLRESERKLESRVEQRTAQLTASNEKLERAQRETLEAQQKLVDTLRTSERVLEERVAQRTAELQSSNETLAATLDDLRTTQTQLIQSEKMASLGQLVANVAHEINTPIGAVKCSGKNISDALSQSLGQLPRLFELLDADERALFLRLVDVEGCEGQNLSTREERARIRELAARLELAGIDDARQKAGTLVLLNTGMVVEDFLPLLRHPECNFILNLARLIATLTHNTQNINTAVDRVSRIVFALKAFSRMDDSGEKVEFNLVDGLETVLTIYNNQLKQGTKLIRNYQDVPPIRCLPDELNQVWTNLIHNALQAMNHQGTLTIGLRKGDNEVIVSVTDTGCGIADKIRHRIFEPFFTTKAAGEGGGLGLDIVKRIVERHMGRIEVESQVGVGTTFSVHLPCVAAPA